MSTSNCTVVVRRSCSIEPLLIVKTMFSLLSMHFRVEVSTGCSDISVAAGLGCNPRNRGSFCLSLTSSHLARWWWCGGAVVVNLLFFPAGYASCCFVMLFLSDESSRATAFMWAGLHPQHPPMMVAPRSFQRFACFAYVSGIMVP